MNCKIKNLLINYEIKGEGKPIIMLHGYSVDHRLMTGCMEPVFSKEDNFKRIYMDLPGMGRSDSADWITNSDIMLDIVIDFINKIIPGENFLLAGESYGGYLARGILFKMMERVEGVLLICPAIIADRKRRNISEHTIIVKDKNLLSRLTREEAEDFNSIAVVQSEEIYKRYKEEILFGVSLSNEKFLNYLQQNGYEFSFNVDKIDKKFDKPSLLLLGKQDSSVGYKDAWDILDNFPRASFAVLDSAGHNLQLEQPDLFNALVREWLMRTKK